MWTRALPSWNLLEGGGNVGRHDGLEQFTTSLRVLPEMGQVGDRARADLYGTLSWATATAQEST